MNYTDNLTAPPRPTQARAIAAAAGINFAELERIFASIGVWEIPTDAAGFDEAFGLPPGSTVAAMGSPA